MSQVSLKTVGNKKGNIFSKYDNKKSIFKNKKVLSTNFIPNKILHREEQIEQMASILSPTLKGYPSNNTFIYGTTGTGKSMCTRFVLNQLSEKESNIKIIYINCKMKKVADTEYRLFAQLLRNLGVSVPDTGLPTDVLYRKFFKKIDQHKQGIIIALDEIDVLVEKVGDEFLYNFTRISSELNNAYVTIMGITNDLSFSNNLDARVKSSLGQEEIIFRPYNAIQLKDILKRRVEKAFRPQTVKDVVIGKCAALAAQEHGDARRALDLLKVAAELAERNNETGVKEKHVDQAEKKIDTDRIVESVQSQPTQSQLVLYTIINLYDNNEDQVLTGDVYDSYKQQCKNTGHKILTQRRVSDLIGELDMLGIITAHVISKGRYGRTRNISLATPNTITDKVRRILKTKLFM